MLRRKYHVDAEAAAEAAALALAAAQAEAADLQRRAADAQAKLKELAAINQAATAAKKAAAAAIQREEQAAAAAKQLEDLQAQVDATHQAFRVRNCSAVYTFIPVYSHNYRVCKFWVYRSG